MQHDVPSIAVSALAQYLAAGIPGLTVLEEWPQANEALKYPSVTITKNNPKRVPQMPTLVSQVGPDMKTNKIVANEYVADWDDSFQIDVWCRTKIERKQIVEQIHAAFSAQELDTSGSNIPDGLSLLVPSYFGEFFRFEIETSQSVDDEAAAQRQERRQKIVVLFNCREIRQRTYYAIKSTQLDIAVSETIDVTDSASAPGTEQHNF